VKKWWIALGGVALAIVLFNSCQKFEGSPSGQGLTSGLEAESKSAADFGYEADPELMCTQEFNWMYKVGLESCVKATDGCQSAYLKQMGFDTAAEDFCGDLRR
jgi:hypothetical protein